MSDLIDRQAAIEIIQSMYPGMPRIPWMRKDWQERYEPYIRTENAIRELPSAQPERKWIPCSNPPKHHKDVIVRGIEAIGNVTVHKVMQWDVDTWRPTDYAPSVMWKEWSEI